MKRAKSRLMIYAAIAAVVGVAGNFISASIILQTKSNSWIIISAFAVGASLVAAYITLVASRGQSIETSMSKNQVFLSYVKEDEAQAETIYKRLQSEGLKPWMDTKNLAPGENWISSIEQAIEDSSFLVILISKNSVSKEGFVQREIKLALELLEKEAYQDKLIIPTQLDNTIIPEPLAKFHSVSLFDENGFSSLIGALQKSSNKSKKPSIS